MKSSYQNPKKGKDADKKIAKAFGKEFNISWKHSNEICYAIRGMMLNKAIAYLEKVQKMEEFVPLRRHKKQVPHRKGKGRVSKTGRWPVKAAKAIVGVLNNASANAEYKGLDTDKLKIEHATAYKSVELERRKPKGSAIPHNIELTNVEIVVREL
jgi:large subunit ribosomal protein L22